MAKSKNTLYTSDHINGLAIYFFVLIFSSVLPIAALAAGTLFFLITSWQVLKRVIILAFIVGGACFIFPVLIPIAFMLAVVFFLLRIKFVFSNWRALLVGIYVYGTIFFFGGLSVGKMTSASDYLVALGMVLICVILLHFMLVKLYRYGYTTKSAFGIMGLVPLIAIAFVLPFLKLPVFTGHDAVFMGNHSIVPDHPVVSGDHMTCGDGQTVNGVIVPKSVNPYAAPPTVHVNSYVKGDGTYVGDHLRTAPDGNPTNNLSYHDKT